MRLSSAEVGSSLFAALAESGYETLEQLARESYSKISGLRGIDSSDMDDIERALATRGLKLRDRPKERSEFYQQIGVYP